MHDLCHNSLYVKYPVFLTGCCVRGNFSSIPPHNTHPPSSPEVTNCVSPVTGRWKSCSRPLHLSAGDRDDRSKSAPIRFRPNRRGNYNSIALPVNPQGAVEAAISIRFPVTLVDTAMLHPPCASRDVVWYLARIRLCACLVMP